MPFCAKCHDKITQDDYAMHRVVYDDNDKPCHVKCLRGDKLTLKDCIKVRKSRTDTDIQRCF